MADIKQIQEFLKSLEIKFDYSKAKELVRIIEERMYEIRDRKVLREVLKGEGASKMLRFLGYSQVGRPHEMMDEFFERTKDSTKRIQVIFGFRGLGKSTYRMAKNVKEGIINPAQTHLLFSSKKDIACKFLDPIKLIFENNKRLKIHLGELQGKNTWNKNELKLKGLEESETPTQNCTFETGGVDSKSAGTHYDIIDVDDIMGKENAFNSKELENLINGFPLLMPLLNPGGKIRIWAMRWYPGDFYETEILEKLKDVIDLLIIPPFVVNEEGKCVDIDGEETEDKVGNYNRIPIMPVPFSHEYLDGLRLTMNEQLWSAHMMQNPVRSSFQTLDFEKLIVVSKDYLKQIENDMFTGKITGMQKVLIVDTSNTVSKQSNAFGLTVWHYDTKRLFIVRTWKKKYLHDDIAMFIAQKIVQPFNLEVVLLEKSGAYENIRHILRKHLNSIGKTKTRIEPYTHGGINKHVRIAGMGPFVEMQGVWIHPDYATEIMKGGKAVSIHRELKKEMEKFPDEATNAEDNIIDTFPGALEFFNIDSELWDPAKFLPPKKLTRAEELAQEEEERHLCRPPVRKAKSEYSSGWTPKSQIGTVRYL